MNRKDTYSCCQWNTSFQHRFCFLWGNVFWFSTFIIYMPLILFLSPLLHFLANLIDAGGPGVTGMKKAQIQLNYIAGLKDPCQASSIQSFPQRAAPFGFCIFQRIGNRAIHVRDGSDHSFRIRQWAVLLISFAFVDLPSQYFFCGINTGCILYSDASKEILFLPQCFPSELCFLKPQRSMLWPKTCWKLLNISITMVIATRVNQVSKGCFHFLLFAFSTEQWWNKPILKELSLWHFFLF